MPILIDQLNVNARVVTSGSKTRFGVRKKNKPASASSSPKVVIDLLQRALDAKRW